MQRATRVRIVRQRGKVYTHPVFAVKVKLSVDRASVIRRRRTRLMLPSFFSLVIEWLVTCGCASSYELCPNIRGKSDERAVEVNSSIGILR